MSGERRDSTNPHEIRHLRTRLFLQSFCILKRLKLSNNNIGTIMYDIRQQEKGKRAYYLYWMSFENQGSI